MGCHRWQLTVATILKHKIIFYQVSFSFSIKYNFSLSLIFSQFGLSFLPSLFLFFFFFFFPRQCLFSPSLGSRSAFLSWHRPSWLEFKIEKAQLLGWWLFCDQGGLWLGFCARFWVQKTNLKNGRRRVEWWVVLFEGSRWVTNGGFFSFSFSFSFFTQVAG